MPGDLGQRALLGPAGLSLEFKRIGNSDRGREGALFLAGTFRRRRHGAFSFCERSSRSPTEKSPSEGRERIARLAEARPAYGGRPYCHRAIRSATLLGLWIGSLGSFQPMAETIRMEKSLAKSKRMRKWREGRCRELVQIAATLLDARHRKLRPGRNVSHLV